MTDDIKNNQMLKDGTKTDPDLPPKSAGSIIFRALLCIIIIAGGVWGAKYLTRPTPKANRRPPAKIIPRVQVQTLVPTNQAIIIKATGTVVPAKKITLKSPVAGEVIKTNPEFSKGGFLKKNALVLKVDDTDYQLALVRKQSEMVSARYAIALEQGRQEVARREWSLINQNKPAGDDELALRKPHLEKVQADLTAALAGIKQAKLNLQRTQIHSPFNAIVLAQHVEKGSQLTVHEPLADLVGTDEYWAQVSIPADRLKWISIPGSRKKTGSAARVIYRDAVRTGSVIKLLGDLEPEGRMARLLIAIKDPLGIKQPNTSSPPLLIGEYIRVEIAGKQIDNIYRVPRTALRNNTHLWIAGKDKKLEIRPVETIWRDTDTVFIQSGLKPGEQLIISDLSTPIAGMPLRLVDSNE
jgi:RND family efflux transporter MFP subunit